MSKTPDEAVEAYVKLRDAIKEKEEEIKKLKEIQANISAFLLSLCSEKNGVTSIRTEHGTVTRTLKRTFWTNDWENFHKFLQDNDALHLLQKRIHDGNMKEFLEENPDLVPVGLQSDAKYIISVRKTNPK